jgi:hypothetical protein
VDTFPFEVRFTSSQPAFQKVLNDFAASNKQFFITRTLLIQNSNPKPVSKADAAALSTPAPTPASSPAPGTPDNSAAAAPPSDLTFIVGTEKLDVALRVDMVVFNPPASATRRGGGRR